MLLDKKIKACYTEEVIGDGTHNKKRRHENLIFYNRGEDTHDKKRYRCR